MNRRLFIVTDYREGKKHFEFHVNCFTLQKIAQQEQTHSNNSATPHEWNVYITNSKHTYLTIMWMASQIVVAREFNFI